MKIRANRISFPVIASLLVAIFTAITCTAQTLKADYQFQGNMNSSVGTAPPMTSLVAAGNGPNGFNTSTVDGYSRQVLEFPANNGVNIPDLTGIVPDTTKLTVVMLFQFNDSQMQTKKLRLFDYSACQSQTGGRYLLNGKIEGETGSHAASRQFTYLQVVITRAGIGGNVDIYRDGQLATTEADEGTVLSMGLRFLHDCSWGLATTGYLARIRIYDAAMTAQQVHALNRVPETPTGSMPVLFYSNRNGVNEMYRMNTDGTSQKRVTTNEVLDYVGKFSPDGTKIVYQRRETATDPFQIWMSNADGTNPVRLTNTTLIDHFPSWRPDGQKILFSRCIPAPGNGSCDLFTMNPDGSNQAAIVTTAGDEDVATYTPNGSKLVFACSDQNLSNYQICVSNPDGSNRVVITNTVAPVVSTYINVSPDGTKLVCVQGSNAGDNLIKTMNLDGSNVFTWPTLNNPQLPLWSPDGTKIMYSRSVGAFLEVFVANADGSSPVQITVNSADDIATDWYRPQTTRRTFADFDGDGKTDLSIFRPNGAASEWWWLKSGSGGNAALQFGASTDRIVPSDYTGDGKTDVAFWRPSTGQWFILRSEDFSFFAFPFGATGDVPVPADYDGDGKADAAVFRASAATWYINKSSGGTDIIGFGAASDLPVNADYDGDGKADVAIYRPNGPGGAEWWVRRSSNASVFALQFGSSTDKAVPGDFTGDGKADVAFWRPSTGFWNILRSEDFSYYAFPFGANGDVASPGDYDGDGKLDAAVFRPSNSTWYANRSTAGTLIQQFGATGDVPVPSAFVR